MDLDRILKPEEIIDRLKYAETQFVKGYYYILIRPDVRDRIVELLKEQSKAKPVIRKQCKTEHPDGSVDYFAEWFCPHCNSLLKRGFDAAWIEYCFKCGKPITWEGQ